MRGLHLIFFLLISSFWLAACSIFQRVQTQPNLPMDLQVDLPSGLTLNYQVVGANNASIAEYQSRITGLERLGDRQTWVVETDIQTSSGPQQQANSKDWIDQNSGIALKSEYQVRYSKPQTNTFDGKKLQIAEFRNTREYDLVNNKMQETQQVLDTEGQTHTTSTSAPSDLDVFRIRRDLQKDEFYPDKNAPMPHQVVELKKVTVPAGTFDTWVLKHELSQNNQYYLEYFDRASGLMIKLENWARSGDKWEIIEETQLVSVERK